jgi:hypothetical protein
MPATVRPERRNATPSKPNPIAAAFATLRIAEPAQFKNLTLYPLVALKQAEPRYLLLDEALARNLARVTEVSESGAVPELLFVNDADDKVLLIDGEELVGARQNRILNVTLLVGGRQKVVIPVSCVEQGRWAWQSRHFAAADRTLFAKARAKKAQQVSASLRESGSRYANQAEIWSDISAKAACLSVDSCTDAMADIYTVQRDRIDDYVQAYTPQRGQAGALFAIDGRVTGMELFDSSATFRKFMAKIVRSYALDALETATHRLPGENRDPPHRLPGESRDPENAFEKGQTEAAHHFLDTLKSAPLQRFPALADGEDLRLESADVAGGALYAEGRLIHLCAFRLDPPASRPIGRGGNIEADCAGIDFEIPAFLRRHRRVSVRHSGENRNP